MSVTVFFKKTFFFFIQKIRYWFLIMRLECRHHVIRTERSGALGDTDVIVSLTSYPERFASLHLTIESLFRQTLPPSQIILWLSEEEASPDTLPRSVRVLQRKGLTVIFKKGNLKSFKKLVYALQEYPESPIITADDDIIYPKDFVEKIYASYVSRPDAIWAYRACRIAFDTERSLAPYCSWGSPNSPEPSHLTFATSGGGVLFPPHSLHPDVTHSQVFLSLCPTADDVWFNVMALLKGSKIGLVNRQSTDVVAIASAQRSALWHQNLCGNQNDVQLKNVFEHYNVYEDLKNVDV